MRIPSGVTDQYIYFVALDPVTGDRETGLSSFTVYYARNATTDTQDATPSVTEVDSTTMPGVYAYQVAEDTTIGAGNDSEEYVLHITQASMLPVTRVIEIYRPKITAGNTLGVESDGDLTKVNTLDGHTAQTGDSFARLGAPAGASVSADIATVDSNVDAILVDTSTTLDNLVDDLEARLGTPSDLGGGATIAQNLADMAGATFSTTTDTLEALRNRGDAAWTTATGFSTHAAADVWTAATRNLTALGFNLDTTDFAAGAIDAAALATDAGQEIADRLIARNIEGGSDTGRTVEQVFARIRNRVAISGGTMTVYKIDDSTSSWTGAVTTASGDPVSEINPA